MAERRVYPSARLGAVVFAGCLALVLATPAGPAQAQRTSLESLAGDHGNIQDVQNGGATPIFACGRIDTPGAYVVVQNLDAVGGACLAVAVDNVTIDLGGHVLAGDGTGFGIIGFAPSGNVRHDIAVRNGTVTDFETGLALLFVSGAHVTGVRAVDNAGAGIVTGPDSMIANSVAAGNGGTGIVAGAGSSVTGSTSAHNEGHGFIVRSNSVVRGNAASDNGLHGILAIIGVPPSFDHPRPTVAGSVVTGNTVSRNGNRGISALIATSITDNSVTENGDSGIQVQNHNTVSGNVIHSNGLAGIVARSGNTISDNTVSGNAVNGIFARFGSGNSISNNTTSENEGPGIVALCPSKISGNASTGNTGANLVALGPDCLLIDNLAP